MQLYSLFSFRLLYFGRNMKIKVLTTENKKSKIIGRI